MQSAHDVHWREAEIVRRIAPARGIPVAAAAAGISQRLAEAVAGATRPMSEAEEHAAAAMYQRIGLLRTALQMRRSLEEVAAAAERRGVLFGEGADSQRVWTARHERMVIERYRIDGAAALATATGRTVDAIKHRAKTLGAQRVTRVEWSEADDAKLRDMWPTHSASQIAAKIGRTKNSIIGRVTRLGLSGPSVSDVPGIPAPEQAAGIDEDAAGGTAETTRSTDHV